ncbi:hypothetical protein [Streptomyces chumphonensis]|uniref:hypothetical protein n=1 Tax=Streptomyces chumphonensis TaxID=1214925 RepID=UPI003D72585D
MSYPPPHQQQPPHQPYPYAPPPPKKRTGLIVTMSVIGAVVAFTIFGSIIGALGEDDTADTKAPPAAAADDKPADEPEPKAEEKEEPEPEPEEKPAEKPEPSQADQFKACVADKGTPAEQDVIGHVTKVTGTDNRNDIIDTAEVFTDYKGDLISDDAASGKLIASAFATCYQSDNGLVTIYNQSGEILSNGNY